MSTHYPATRVLFDRKHVATKEKVGLVQIEVMYERKRKFISTGVKVYQGEWSERSHVINRPDMFSLNHRIDEVKGKIDEYINGIIEQGAQFSFDNFDRWLSADNEKQMSFIEWASSRIEQRTDIARNTRKSHRKIVAALCDFGRIVSFSELTKANIMRFDDYLHSKMRKQTTIYTYHRILRTYIHEAMRRELIDKDPYLGIKLDRGKSEWGRFLTIEELQMVQTAKMPTQSIERVRDLFVLQCLTGMAYADLMEFDYSRVQESNGQTIYSVERVKTGIPFTAVLLPKALEILKKYNYHIPPITNQQYNMRLKVVADAAGIDKPIASHYGRRTCGMVLLNDGFPIEVVAKVLGHSNIKTTQEAYARILDNTVAKEFAKRNTTMQIGCTVR